MTNTVIHGMWAIRFLDLTRDLHTNQCIVILLICFFKEFSFLKKTLQKKQLVSLFLYLDANGTRSCFFFLGILLSPVFWGELCLLSLRFIFFFFFLLPLFSPEAPRHWTRYGKQTALYGRYHSNCLILWFALGFPLPRSILFALLKVQSSHQFQGSWKKLHHLCLFFLALSLSLYVLAFYCHPVPFSWKWVDTRGLPKMLLNLTLLAISLLFCFVFPFLKTLSVWRNKESWRKLQLNWIKKSW